MSRRVAIEFASGPRVGPACGGRQSKRLVARLKTELQARLGRQESDSTCIFLQFGEDSFRTAVVVVDMMVDLVFWIDIVISFHMAQWVICREGDAEAEAGARCFDASRPLLLRSCRP